MVYLFLSFNFRHVSHLVLMFLLLPLNMEIPSKGMICVEEYGKSNKFFISRANSFFCIQNGQNSGKRSLGNLGMGISVSVSAYNYSLLHSLTHSLFKSPSKVLYIFVKHVIFNSVTIDKRSATLLEQCFAKISRRKILGNLKRAPLRAHVEKYL